MLQHNVYFYLKDAVTSAEKQQFEAGLKELLQTPGLHKAEIGVPGATPEREVTDHGFAYAIYTWFKTIEDHDIYQEHPRHKEFIEKYSALWAKVRVYDAEIIHAQ
ncbi:MAG: Dabb family protein [Verrucomicrobia bacterium]|nr:Dabb family protein [Verrucomicrobiota bacterium]MCH8510887.1 Dabb family protein [Kiritimatiellia bacterium]